MNLHILKKKDSMGNANVVAPEHIKQSVATLERQVKQVRDDVYLHLIEMRAVEREIRDILQHYFMQLSGMFESLPSEEQATPVNTQEAEGASEAASNVVALTETAAYPSHSFFEKNVKTLYKKLSALWGNSNVVLYAEEEELFQLFNAAYQQLHCEKDVALEEFLVESTPIPAESPIETLNRLSQEYEKVLEMATQMSMFKRELWNSPAYILHQRILWGKAHKQNQLDPLQTLIQKLVKKREKGL